jgi:hypothetical protein
MIRSLIARAAKSYIPSRALNAGSTRPPLAIKTALTTAASMLGKASFKVFSACCCGLNGRGGLGGGISSLALWDAGASPLLVPS